MRTKNSVKNILSVVIFNLIIGILGFIKVRIFINGLSNDIYSLNQLFYQIFGYIALADLGIGLVLNGKLYNAFVKNDKDKINQIYSTTKRFYLYTGILMFLIAFLVSFFVQFLTKAAISPIYIQIVFLIFIIRNIIDYFFAAPRIVLEANQKNYMINHYIKSIKIIEIICEIILVLLGVDYLFVLIPGIIITLIIDIYVNKKIYKFYPWLEDKKTFNKEDLKGTKNVVFQKIAGLFNSNTDVILISTFINPITVIIYTTYTYITKFITDTIHIVSGAITPSYANIVCGNDQDKSYNVFNEMNIFFLFLASFITIMLYGFLNSLITFWVGKEYLVSNITLLLFCIITFQLIADKALVIMVNSKGLFKETKNANIAEAILNLIISFTLVHKFGLLGVLIGTITSKILTTFINYPIVIYKDIFNKKSWKYFMNYGCVFLITGIFLILFNILNLEFTSLFKWIIYVIIIAFAVAIILFIIFYLCFKSFRNLTNRGLEFIKVKGQYTE